MLIIAEKLVRQLLQLPLVTAEEKTEPGYSLSILCPVSYARVKLSLQHDVFSALT